MWLGISIWSITEGSIRWPIFLTSWSLVVELLYLGVALYNTWLVRPSNSDIPAVAPASVKLAWLLNGITLPVATLVAVGYWALVYRPPFNPISACTHGLNLLVILVDAMVCSHTYVLSQYCVALAFSVLYYVWSGIHAVADVGGENGESYIYANVDWKDAPTATVVTLIITLFVGMPIIVCLIRLCFYVRGVHKSEGMQVQIHAV